MTAQELYTALDELGIDYEVVEIFEGARFIRVEVDDSNYAKACYIYEKKGQSAVYDAVNSGELTCDEWRKCVPCEDETPHEDGCCLVCGTKAELGTRPVRMRSDLIEEGLSVPASASFRDYDHLVEPVFYISAEELEGAVIGDDPAHPDDHAFCFVQLKDGRGLYFMGVDLDFD